MPLKLEIFCDVCELPMDIEPIYSWESAANLCNIMDWVIINLPQNSDAPEKQYYICPSCDEHEFIVKELHIQCCSNGKHKGKIFRCPICGKKYCENHFSNGFCKLCK